MWIKKHKDLFQIILLALIGSIIMVSLLSTTSFQVFAFEIDLAIQIFDRGYTEVNIPPIGTVRAQTHIPPLKLAVNLTNINLDVMEEITDPEKTEEIMALVIATITERFRVFIVRLLVLATLGGCLAVGVFYKKPKHVLLGGVIGLVLMGILIGVTFSTYDDKAFENPEFEGILYAAPWMFGLLEESFEKLEDFSQQLEMLTVNLYTLFESIQYLDPLGTVDGDVKILHVSDIHNHPVAYDFIGQVIRSFNVDMVVDTGDITDYGTSLEAELISKLDNIDIPYVISPGNHDSPAVIERLQQMEDVIVLVDDVVDVNGVVIAGVADPSSESTAMAVEPDEVYIQQVDKLRQTIEQSGKEPLIINTHHPLISQELQGEYPLLFQGHTHRLEVNAGDNDSIIINPGSTGASGIRGLLSKNEVPYSLVLIHLKQDGEANYKVAAIDSIDVFNLSSGFSLNRQLILDQTENNLD
ncbi:metallophosphoesterase [Proteinivorax hydrogeniformans]|uniref:Metallophosphoesterase n=1 Tax=Proteinivorax hydrogeniformans TaxID=1826727 RepID=A0AAU8HQN0_9FIRM